MPTRKLQQDLDTIRAISNNTDKSRELLVNSAERLEALAVRYRELAAAIDETN